MSSKVEAYLEKNKAAAKGDVADLWNQLLQLYNKKLWHQLTKELRANLEKPAFVANLNLKDFYDNFIADFEHKINALDLAEIAIPVSKFMFAKGKESAYEFLNKVEKTVAKDKTAMARIHTGQIELRLSHQDASGRLVDIKKVRDLIESTQKEIDDLYGVTPAHAPFYKVSARFLRELGDFAGYYREALRYLGVEDINKLTNEERHCEAVLVGFAALLGEGVYNFGELLAHPILSSLKGSAEAWISELLFAFNAGDLQKFYAMEPQWSSWDDLKKRKEFMLEKIRLLAVMEISLARPAKERRIPFKEIAAKCQVELNEVEHIVMKALSRGLIQGAIDQVEQVVHVTWVQPRVLDAKQIRDMAARIADWRKDVTSMETTVAVNAKEILTRS